ncbi:MAG: thioesterase [Chitinophagaceae bacterium]|nr:thioesterase [Chitinophagaceae bacterium]
MYKKSVEVRWSDMDPNFHVRHSIYYDWGAFCRISFLHEHGLTPEALTQYQIGPILFREECIFKKEIRLDDKVEVNVMLLKCNKDATRWSMVHEIWKNKTVLAAVITIDGAWIDLTKRKLGTPPQVVIDGFDLMPKAPGFTWLDSE